ncbi:hypothetical protein TEA_002042 [Camellia sinensis var. sinensis]|uniref:Uncharacterized protein n=1 Tax=Camellia sinensis var. sinensis TaxID=542762 RepID=A0A4S4D3F7_CAMSN|nr:hypothetical protein TEA_002042 [Camellia sinensis var. sinensis]
MRAQQSKFLASINSITDDGLDGSEGGEEACPSDIRSDTGEPTQDVCSLCHDPNSKGPPSFLILLQIGVFLDRRVLFYILPIFSFVLLYSNLPHKGIVLDMAKSCTFPLPLLAVAFQHLIADTPVLAQAWEKVYGVNITNAVNMLPHLAIVVTFHDCLTTNADAAFGRSPPTPALFFAASPPTNADAAFCCLHH